MEAYGGGHEFENRLGQHYPAESYLILLARLLIDDFISPVLGFQQNSHATWTLECTQWTTKHAVYRSKVVSTK